MPEGDDDDPKMAEETAAPDPCAHCGAGCDEHADPVLHPAVQRVHRRHGGADAEDSLDQKAGQGVPAEGPRTLPAGGPHVGPVQPVGFVSTYDA